MVLAPRWRADTARPDEERVKELYRWVFSREPNAEELEVAIAYIKKHADNVREAMKMWSGL
jgi:hypothetical protein